MGPEPVGENQKSIWYAQLKLFEQEQFRRTHRLSARDLSERIQLFEKGLRSDPPFGSGRTGTEPVGFVPVPGSRQIVGV